MKELLYKLHEDINQKRYDSVVDDLIKLDEIILGRFGINGFNNDKELSISIKSALSSKKLTKEEAKILHSVRSFALEYKKQKIYNSNIIIIDYYKKLLTIVNNYFKNEIGDTNYSKMFSNELDYNGTLKTVKKEIKQKNFEEAKDELYKIAISFAKPRLENGVLRNTDIDYLVVREIEKENVFDNDTKTILLNILKKTGKVEDNLKAFERIVFVDTNKDCALEEQKNKPNENEKMISNSFSHARQNNEPKEDVLEVRRSVLLNTAIKKDVLFERTDFVENNENRIKYAVIRIKNTPNITLTNENDYLLLKRHYKHINGEYKKVINYKNIKREEKALRKMGICNLHFSNGEDECCVTVSYIVRFQKPTFDDKALVKRNYVYVQLKNNGGIKDEIKLIKLGFKHGKKNRWYLDNVVDAYEYKESDLVNKVFPSCQDLIDIGVSCGREYYASLGNTCRYRTYKFFNAIINLFRNTKRLVILGAFVSLIFLLATDNLSAFLTSISSNGNEFFNEYTIKIKRLLNEFIESKVLIK